MESHNSHSIRGFLKAKKQQRKQKQQQKRQLQQQSQLLQPQQITIRDSITSSFSSNVAPSEASSSSTEEVEITRGQQIVKMEGMLKKRAAKMPVMHDRYCVATWEMDNEEHKCVVLRSYKSRKTYDAHPERPTSVHLLKCISDWDGKTGFHRYQHAFTMETRDKKLFQCVAPSATEKDKWVELMAIQSAFSMSSNGGPSGGRDMRLGSVGSLVPLRRTASIESADNGKPRAYTSASMDKKLRTESDMNGADAHSTDSEDHLQFPGRDGLFRSVSGDSMNSAGLAGDKTGEPADWGLYGENGDATVKSKYEVVDDTKPVLLDKELLDSRGEKTKTLAADAYLFGDGNKSRFGAVVVKGAEGSREEDDDDEFVDEELAARQAQKENQKQMRRRAEKLESNRDRYAEMAAARLASMRKDARHPKKPSHSHSRPSVGSYSDEEDLDESIAVEGDAESVVELEEMTQRHSSRSHRSSKSHKKSFVSSSEQDNLEEDQVVVDDAESLAEMEEMTQRHSSRSHRSSKSHKKSFVSSNKNTNSLNGGYVSGDDEEEEEEESAPPTTVESEEAEELRQLKKKYRAERRAKKRLQREKEEEERAALQAAEMARAHREEQRAREADKTREELEKRDKKERREMKEKLKREKAKQRQAEAELRKLVELKQAEEERREQERKDKKEKKDKKKSKKKEKYTTPAERIQKKEERDADRAAASAAALSTEAEVSNALVVVETPQSTPQPSAAPETALTPVSTSTSPSVQTEAMATEQTPIPAPVAPVAPVAPAPVPAPASAPVTIEGMQSAYALSQGMPMYQVAPPPFVPTYPSTPQSMPAYGLAATFGAYPPLYPTPYSYGAPVGPQPTYMRPNLGFVAGLSAMGSFGKAAGPEPAPSSEYTAEAMIGPQFPTPEERAAASSIGVSVSSSPPPPPPFVAKSEAKLMNLPELPDVVEF